MHCGGQSVGRGRGWGARNEAAGKGRPVSKGLVGQAEGQEVRKGGEGCLCFRKTLPGAMLRRDRGMGVEATF